MLEIEAPTGSLARRHPRGRPAHGDVSKVGSLKGDPLKGSIRVGFLQRETSLK